MNTKISVNFFNPYCDILPLSEEVFQSDRLTDSDGFLTLNNELSIIAEQSEINQAFRLGQIEAFKANQEDIINSLSDFEEDPIINSSLLRFEKSGDIIDKVDNLDTIRHNAYLSNLNPVLKKKLGLVPPDIIEPEPDFNNKESLDDNEKA